MIIQLADRRRFIDTSERATEKHTKSPRAGPGLRVRPYSPGIPIIRTIPYVTTAEHVYDRRAGSTRRDGEHRIFPGDDRGTRARAKHGEHGRRPEADTSGGQCAPCK